MFNARTLIRTGPEAAAAITTRYQERPGSNGEDDGQLRQPITSSEVDEASSMIFQRAPATPSDYVFSPSGTVPAGLTGGQVYPRLRHNQVLRGEVLAMGRRLAAHPGVQSAIIDDLVEHGRRVPSGRRGIHPNLQAPPSDERGLARLVDMLDSEEEYSQRSSRGTNRAGRGGDSGLSMVLQRDRRGMFDHDDEEPLQHLHLDPRVSEELEDAYAAVQDDGWQPWQEEEKKEDASESDLSSSRLSDGKLGCSCKKCHADRNPLVADEEDPSEGTCWKDVLAEYECDICFEVLVGVHVLDNCGHTFCGACMERWIDNAPKGECPVCRTPVDKLVPVRKMDEMIAKAVEAAAPSRERTAWYERKAHWERNVRRRQEARAAGPSHSVVHAQGAAATSRPGVARWQEAMGARGAGGRNGTRAGARGPADGDGEEEDGGNDGYRLNKIQTVLAVAVMLVMAVFKLRSVR